MTPRDELLTNAELVDCVSHAIEKGHRDIAFVDEDGRHLETHDLPTVLGNISRRLRQLADELGDTIR